MTKGDGKALIPLLAKLLNASHKQGKHRAFEHAWNLLHILGAQVQDQGDEFWVISSN